MLPVDDPVRSWPIKTYVGLQRNLKKKKVLLIGPQEEPLQFSQRVYFKFFLTPFSLDFLFKFYICFPSIVWFSEPQKRFWLDPPLSSASEECLPASLFCERTDKGSNMV